MLPLEPALLSLVFSNRALSSIAALDFFYVYYIITFGNLPVELEVSRAG